MPEERPSTLVIADDDAGFAALVEAILAEQGYEVVARAPNGEEAVRLAAELRPDLVLMDLNMPVLDGFEATRRIRRELPATRVFVLSGGLTEEEGERALAAGAAAYLEKEHAADHLVKALALVLRRA